MYYQELMKHFVLRQSTVEKIWINPLKVLVDDEFDDKQSKGDYRDRAIERVLKTKVNFDSEFNSIVNLIKKVITVTCPHCGVPMPVHGGGGNGEHFTTTFHCDKCKLEIDLGLECDGSISFRYPIIDPNTPHTPAEK